MGVRGWLIRRQLRQRWVVTAALGLIVALGSGAALVALGAAVRTADAYPTYLREANVGDLAGNPSLQTTAIDAAIRALPGVEQVTSDMVFLAFLGEAEPMTRAQYELQSDEVQVRGSIDGRFTEMDRPAVEHGRMPTGRGEALVSAELAEREGIELGDDLPVSFWNASDDVLAEPETIVTPIGVEHLRVVGVATLPDEVLPDGLFPRGRVLVSPDVAARYGCVPEAPPKEATYEEAAAVLLPAGCALTYPYYSIRFARGAAGVAPALVAFEEAAAELSLDLPEDLLADGVRYSLIPTSTGDERARVERSTQPTAAALGVLAVGTAAVTAVAALLATARELRRSHPEQLHWWRLGLGTRARVLVLATPAALAVVVGTLVALAVAWAASPVAPLGSVRSVDPSPGRDLDRWVLLGALGLAAVELVGAAALTARAARRLRAPDRVRTSVPMVERVIRSSSRPEVGEGLRAAYGSGRGAGLVAGSGGVAAGVFVAAVVFGSSLAHMIATPAAYGWPWDLAMMGGFGYGSQDVPALIEDLDGHAVVERWAGLAFGSATVDGEAVTMVVGLGAPASSGLTVLSGRLPTAPDEVALGARTASALGVEEGDSVDLTGDATGTRRAQVTGTVVLPALGPLQSDRASPGAGMYAPAAAFAEEELAQEITFVGLDLVDGVSVAAAQRDLHDDFASWALDDVEPIELPEPVRPPEIVDAASLRTMPLLVGGLLAAAAAAGLFVAIAFSVRARRRELGTLRALGCTGRQLRTSVRVQAVASMAVALAIGVPLGIAGGRLAWRAFAERLGVATDPTMPGLWIAGTVLGGLVVAVAAASIPGRSAARSIGAIRTQD